MTSPLPPPGWYPDSTVSGQQRYWDGRAWTEHTAGLTKPDWCADPTGRHEYRYWDGSSWTAQVADAGKTSADPLDVAPTQDSSAANEPDDTGAQHQKDVGVADVARTDGTSTEMVSGLATLGLRFDIDKLEERGDGYGFEAWKVLWNAVDPIELGVALLFEGDTMATLRRSENVFCIAIQADEPALSRVRDVVTQNADFRTVAAAPDQVEGDALVAEPLVSAGNVDASGNLGGDAFWAGAALNSLRAEASAPAVDAEAPEVEVPAVDASAPISEAQDTPSRLGPSCPDCGSDVERRKGGNMSDSDYIREHSPSANPLEDLIGILEWWAESARPVSDQASLGAFMDYIADEWHVSWGKGAPVAMLSWFESCATDDLSSEDGGYRIYGLDVPDKSYGEVVLAGIPGFWEKYGVAGSVIEIGVSRYLHFIGKASEGEFFFLGHV